MADMKKCDRCGHIYAKPDVGFENKISSYTNSRGVVTSDLCSGCAEDFLRFMKNEYVDRRFVIRD